MVGRWQEVNERILQAAITSLGQASRDALGAALPGLRELTGAVDALADDPAAATRPPRPGRGPADPRARRRATARAYRHRRFMHLT